MADDDSRHVDDSGDPVPIRPVDPELLDHPPHTDGWWGTLIHHRIGRRGTFLAILAAMDLTYGAALVSTYPHGPHDTPRWWPASLGRLLDIPTTTWGWIWIGVGCFLLTGVPRTAADRWQFAAGVALKYLWAGASISFWLTSLASGVWGLAAIYLGIAAVTLLASGWSDETNRETHRLRRRRRHR